MTFFADAIGYIMIKILKGEMYGVWGTRNTIGRIYVVKKLFPGWATAQTWGHYILTTTTDLYTISHEYVHVTQYYHYGFGGFGFFAVYLWGWATHGFKYENIPLEVEARNWVKDNL